MKVIEALRRGAGALKARAALGASAAIAVLGETTSTIDTSTMTSLIQSLLPLIVTMIGIAIPIVFFNKIIELIERLLKSFS
ncbi:MAG: hypothetical protein GSR80_000115 [Desulfurococcales archaeon]|nr:hypothetical protein [Desulfurococcales archaeon]